MEHWEGEKFCLYCARSKVTSNRGTPWLTEQSSAAITQPDTETILVCHVGRGEHPLPTLWGQSQGTGRHNLSSHLWGAATGTGIVSASDPLSVDKCWDVLWQPWSLHKAIIQLFLLAFAGLSVGSVLQNWLPLFCKKTTLSVFNQLTPKEPQGHSNSQTLTASARGKKSNYSKRVDGRIFKLNI